MAMVFKAAGNITGQIADHLARQIIDGSMAEGTRIQEVKVAQSLGVSRGSVREALLILQRQHLIDIVPRKGATVRSMSARDISELINLAGVLELNWLPQACLALPPAQPSGLLRQALEEMERAAREHDVAAVLRARSDFFRALLAFHGVYARAVFDCVLPGMERLLHQLIGQADVDLHDLPRYHGALLDAVENKNLERINELLVAFQKRLIRLCAKRGWIVERPSCEPARRATNGT